MAATKLHTIIFEIYCNMYISKCECKLAQVHRDNGHYIMVQDDRYLTLLFTEVFRLPIKAGERS